MKSRSWLPGLTVRTPIGFLPAPGAIDRTGLPVDDADMKELLRVDTEGWRTEIPSIRDHFSKFADRLPQGLLQELDSLETRLRSI